MLALLLPAGSFVAAPQPARAQTTPPDGFSMVVASDPQLTWWRQGEGGVCVGLDDDATKECVDREGRRSNEELITAMNDVGALGSWPQSGLTKGAGDPIRTPRGAIVNGDLTAFWFPEEKKLYEELYPALHYQIYPGLGNHDYQNNTDDCDYDVIYYPDHNRCAKEAVWWMTRKISTLRTSSGTMRRASSRSRTRAPTTSASPSAGT